MLSVAVSALGRTSIHFIDPGVKVNGKYYREVLLTRDLLPEIRQYSEYFIFQQDGAPAHRALETVELMKEVTLNFIQPSLWPPNSPDLNPIAAPAVWNSLTLDIVSDLSCLATFKRLVKSELCNRAYLR